MSREEKRGEWERAGKWGKIHTGLSYLLEEQSQWRGRGMAQQDPGCHWASPCLCTAHLPALCHSSNLCRQPLLQARTRFLQHKAKRALEQLRMYHNNMRHQLQPPRRKNRAFPVSNFVPGEAPCHMRLWATAASVLRTERRSSSRLAASENLCTVPMKWGMKVAHSVSYHDFNCSEIA